MREGVDPAVRPSQDEEVGPLEGLVAATSAETSQEASEVAGDEDPDAESLLARMGVEEEGIESGQLLGLVASVLAAVIALVVILIYLFYIPYRTQIGNQAEGSARTTDLDIIRTEGKAKLNQYSRNDSSYAVPIGQAMGLVVASYGSAEGANLPDSRQDWNTLPIMRGMGDTVQQPSRSETAPEFNATRPSDNAPVEVGVDNQNVPSVDVIGNEPGDRPIE